MQLDELRKEIDSLDEELFRILAKRMGLVMQVAEYKKKNGIPLKQPEREKQLIEQKKMLAGELGLSEAFVEKICRAVIDESLRIEEDH